ncbi:MAG: Mur ligase family protein [Pseudomonadales bacterium]
MTAQALTSLTQWLEYIDVHTWQTGDIGLDKLEVMLERMRIERPAPYVITVAGTNGKGTTCYACEAILLAHGLSVGTAISPHIDRFNERIRLNGEEATDAQIVAALQAVEDCRGELKLTYFEYCVMASFYLFLEAEVDVAVLEIGLGGRLDGFNVVAADCAVITSIGLDHQAILGDTLDAIGREKAGILRPQQRAVLGRDLPESVYQIAAELEVEEIRFGREIEVTVGDGHWQLRAPGVALNDIKLGALATHNLALACVAAAGRIELDPTLTRQVLSELRIRGRLELRRWRERQLILDVAHNPHGIEFLFAELEQRQIQPTVICCAMLKDKDHLGVYRAATRHVDARWLLFDSHGDRGMPATDLREALGGVGECCTGDLQAFLDSATRRADVILALGSFSMVEQLLIGVPERA